MSLKTAWLQREFQDSQRCTKKSCLDKTKPRRLKNEFERKYCEWVDNSSPAYMGAWHEISSYEFSEIPQSYQTTQVVFTALRLRLYMLGPISE